MGLLQEAYKVQGKTYTPKKQTTGGLLKQARTVVSKQPKTQIIPQTPVKKPTIIERAKQTVSSFVQNIKTKKSAKGFLEEKLKSNIDTANLTPEIKQKVVQNLITQTPVANQSATLTPTARAKADIVTDLGLDKIKKIEDKSKVILKEIAKRTSGTGIVATIKSASPEVTFKQAYETARKSQQEKDDTLPEQFITGLKDTLPQTVFGIALGFVPLIGAGLSTSYWAAISAGSEIEEKGYATPSNVAIDVIGDRVLGGMMEKLFKTPAKSLLKIIKQSFITEGGTEVAQDLLKLANDYRLAKTKEERDLIIQKGKDYFTSGQILVTAGVGGVSGGIVGGVVGTISNQTQKNIDIQNKQIGVTEETPDDVPPGATPGSVAQLEITQQRQTIQTRTRITEVLGTNEGTVDPNQAISIASLDGVKNTKAGKELILKAVQAQKTGEQIKITVPKTGDIQVDLVGVSEDLTEQEEVKVPSEKELKTEKVEEPKEVENNILPEDVSISDEAKRTGAKRISPDRIAHQQLTPEQGIESLVEKVKKNSGKNSESWIKVADKVQILIDKYGESMPMRTESNLKKYPNLSDDLYNYSQLKKNAFKPKNLADMKDQFIKNSERSKWTSEREKDYRTRVNKQYIELVKEDISRGYKFPEAVLNYDKSFKTAVDNRERYEKGLRTSFSSDDTRIVFDSVDKIGAGMKRQDGKPITEYQKKEIIDGVIDFSNMMKLDMKELAKDDRWVYVHLSGTNPFLMSGIAGLYRTRKDNISISVGGREFFYKTVDGKKVKEYINPTMAHELGHAIDYKVNRKLIDPSLIYKLKYNYNEGDFMYLEEKYYRDSAEVVARMVEEYVSVSRGGEDHYTRPGYWNKEIFDRDIKPAIEETLDKNFSEYRLKEQITKEETKPTEEQESANKELFIQQAKDSPKMIQVGDFYVKLTPEQTWALKNENEIIPLTKDGKNQVHISRLSDTVLKEKTEIGSLQELADKYPDVKTALEKAKIIPTPQSQISPESNVMKVYGDSALPQTKQKLIEKGNEIISTTKTIDNRGEFVYNVKYQPKSVSPESKGIVKERTVEVPRNQLPVGEGEKKVSRLEARVKDVLDTATQDTVDQLGLTTYEELNKKENIAKASEYVINNPDDAIKVLTGEIEAPKGILRNAIYVAMENMAKGDLNLARKLASITSTRLGQEIGILSEIDKESPVRIMKDVIKIKEEAFKKKYGGRKVSDVRSKMVSEIKTEKVSKSSWSNFISSLEC